MRVQKWGNSLAIRIHKNIVRELGWEQGTLVRETVVDGKLIVEAVPRPTYTLAELLAAMTPKNMYEEVDTGNAVGNEFC